MKKIILLFIITLSLTSFKNTSETDFNIVGKWEGQDNNEVGYLTFQKDSYAYFEINGQIIGGKEFEIKGKKGSMTYEVDFTAKPIQIDLIINIIGEKETHKLQGILEIITNDEIKVSLGFEGPRPTNFDTDESLTFKRVE